MTQTFADLDIDVRGKSGSVKTTCPKCSHTRHHPKDPCLSVNADEGVWHCHNCDWSGSLKNGLGASHPRQKTYTRPMYKPTAYGQEKIHAWFLERGIFAEVIERNRITLGKKFIPGLGKEVDCIQFPYIRNGEVINVKYRTTESKRFVQEAGAEKIFYGLDDLCGCDWAVIVEGEPDKLACEAAGILNVLSVPDGACPAGSNPSDVKFEYIPNCEMELAGLKKIILAVDHDPPGKTLEAELARRLGPERCWRVSWPDGCKDANDVLVTHGKVMLQACLDNALPWPIDGLVEPKDLIDDVLQLYADGWKGGFLTGWGSVDRYYTVRRGEVTIISGVPGHGKSEFCDALTVNLARLHGWMIGVCSPENWPIYGHMAKLLEKWTGRPFGEGPHTRMTPQELADGMQWVQDHFVFFSPPETDMTIEKILELARQAVSRHGIHGLVIDPWNELDHSRPVNLSETEYISKSLTKIRRFARNHDVHVWVIAHPMKLRKREDGTYPVPSPYDISGSAHWRNKADNCLTIYRDVESVNNTIQLHIQKIRFRQVGKIGAVELTWSPVNGRYSCGQIVEDNGQSRKVAHLHRGIDPWN